MLSVDTALPVPAIPAATDATPQNQTAGNFRLALETEQQKLETPTPSDRADDSAAAAATADPSITAPLTAPIIAPIIALIDILEILAAALSGGDSQVEQPSEAKDLPRSAQTPASPQPKPADKVRGQSNPQTEGTGQPVTLQAILVLALGLPAWQNLPTAAIPADKAAPAASAAAPLGPPAQIVASGGLTERLIASVPASPMAADPPTASDAPLSLPYAGVALNVAQAAEAISIETDDAAALDPLQVPRPNGSTSGATVPASGATGAAGTKSIERPSAELMTPDVANAGDAATVRWPLEESGHEVRVEKPQEHGGTHKGAPPAAAPVAADAGLTGRGINDPQSQRQQRQERPDHFKGEDSRSMNDRDAGQPLEHIQRQPNLQAAAGGRIVADNQFRTTEPAISTTIGPLQPGEPVRHVAFTSPKRNEVLQASSDQWNQIEKSNVISQVIEKARLFHWQDNSEIVITLKPAALGRISLRAAVIDQTVVATIIAESDKVRTLLQSELPALHRALQQDGVPARIEVVHGRESSLSAAGGGPSDGSQNPQFRQPNNFPDPWALESVTAGDTELGALPELRDSRYLARSIHLIA